MHSAQFSSDATLTLISRLRQNVIKTGIRKLSLAYSRISLRDICLKLNLDSEEDAEYIVAKAIKDGVIDSTIVHEKGWMVARGYEGERGSEGKSTKTPAAVKGYGPEVVDVFGRRIAFCLQLHNESVRVSFVVSPFWEGSGSLMLILLSRPCVIPSMRTGRSS